MIIETADKIINKQGKSAMLDFLQFMLVNGGNSHYQVNFAGL